MKNKTFFPAIVALACFLPASGFKSQFNIISTSAVFGPNSSVSLPISGTSSCSLPAPDSFDAEKTSETTSFLSWSAVAGATAYQLNVYDFNTHELIFSGLEYGSSKNLNGLDPNADYRCTLASVCSGGSVSDFVIIVDIL